MQSDSSGMRVIRFRLADLPEQVEGFWQRFSAARADEAGGQFGSRDGPGCLRLPLSGPRAQPFERIGDYFERLPDLPIDHGGVAFTAEAEAIRALSFLQRPRSVV